MKPITILVGPLMQSFFLEFLCTQKKGESTDSKQLSGYVPSTLAAYSAL